MFNRTAHTRLCVLLFRHVGMFNIQYQYSKKPS
jgi:hypothetical protein